MKKEYSNGEVTITWEPSKCIHSMVCTSGLPDVFKPKEKPWVQPENATTEELIQRVPKCPSGALTIRYNETDKEINMSNEITGEVIPNGPLMIYGEFEIKLKDGSTKDCQKSTAICRCGHSSNKPFCDGSHSKEGFKG